MKMTTIRGLVLASAALMSEILLGQDPLADDATPKPTRTKKKAAATEERRDRSYLSKPFSDIKTNILDLERSGYFTIVGVDFRTRGTGGEAIVWMVRVNKSVTYRHVEAMLREYRDARFYQTFNDRPFEIVATLVNYSNRIEIGASDGKLFGRDDEFELWIDIPDNFYRKLKSFDADRLVLRRWRY